MMTSKSRLTFKPFLYQLGWHRTGAMGLWMVDTANNEELEGIWVHEQLLEQGLAQPCPAGYLARQLVVKLRVEDLVKKVLVLCLFSCT